MNNMKPTQKALAEYIGKTPRTLQHMRKVSPRMYDLLWRGWIAHNEEQKEKLNQNVHTPKQSPTS